jgi:integrase
MPDSLSTTPFHPTERDLDAILRLLDPATFPAPNFQRPAWCRERDVAAVALCWIVGLAPAEILRLARADWRPGRSDVVQVRVEGMNAILRHRTLPVLERARDAVETYLKACPHCSSQAAPLLLHASGKPLDIASLGRTDRAIAAATSGAVTGLRDLQARYRRVVHLTRATDGSVEWLCGSAGPHEDGRPTRKRLRAALERAHPASLTNLPAVKTKV